MFRNGIIGDQFALNLIYTICMKKRHYQKTRQEIFTAWSTEQDCYLIEHAQLESEQLKIVLPFSADEIKKRKEILGLIRRSKQLRKWL